MYRKKRIQLHIRLGKRLTTKYQKTDEWQWTSLLWKYYSYETKQNCIIKFGFFFTNLFHLDRGRNSAWSWRGAKLCSTRTRKRTEASQRKPSEASPLWILSVESPRWQLTIQRRNMSSDWSEYLVLSIGNISLIISIFFLFRLQNGGDYLFQAVDDEQMNLWVEAINRQAQGLEEGPGKSQTLPPGSDKKDEPKRRSFFTLKKK